MTDGVIPTAEDVPTTDTRAPSGTTRTVSRWAALGAALAAVLVAFGAGYAVNAGDATDVRDDLNKQLHRVSVERDRAEASLALARGSVEECHGAVAGAADLASAADDFTNDWARMQDLFIRYLAAPVGSSEEAELDLEMTQLESKMDTKVGTLTASADRVSADTGVCHAT